MEIKSIESLQEKSVIVFTGAGISYDAPTCLPLGGQLVDILLGKLLEPEIKESLDNTGLRPEVVMQVLWEYTGESIFTALNSLSKRPPNKIHTLLDSLRKYRKISKIVTTNLDLCHEKAVVKADNSAIVHLHGIAGKKDTIMYALDQVSNKRAQGVGSSLQKILQNSTIVFLGYSGRDDFDIAPALANLSSDVDFVWVEHDIRMDKWDLHHDFSISDAHFILSSRLSEKVTYIRGNTWTFLKDWASYMGLDESLKQIESNYSQLSFDSDFIRREVGQSIAESLSTLEDDTARLVVAEFLFRFLNHSEDADQIIGKVDSKKLNFEKQNLYYRLLGYIKYRCGLYSEAEKAFQICLKKGGRDGLILRCLADIAYRKNNFKLAEDLMLQAIKKSENDPKEGARDKGQILNSYGLLLQDTGRRVEAIDVYEEAEELLRKVGDIYGVSDILNNKGTLYSDLINLPEAERAFRESLQLREQINHVQGICYSYLNIGIVKRTDYCMNGNLLSYEEAQVTMKKALEALPESGAELDRALLKKNIGDLYLDKADISKAEKYLLQAYESFSSLDGQEGYEFSCLLSTLELKLLSSEQSDVSRILSSLDLLSKNDQLDEKVSWYNLLKESIYNGFKDVTINDSHPTLTFRYKQLREKLTSDHN